MPKQNLSKRREWKRKLESWEESGLSGPKWCTKNGENYPQFRYWKHTLKLTHTRPLFKELKESHPKSIKLELRQGDITIIFPKGCTPFLLKLCLTTLRKCQCLQ